MGILERFKSYVGKNKKVEASLDTLDLKQLMKQGDLWELVGTINSIQKDRESRLRDYEEMSNHGIVGSAMELMADDATQPDPDLGVSFWIECEKDNKLEKELNTWLEQQVRLEDKIWTYAYHVVKNGEAYLRTFHSDEKFKKNKEIDLGDHFEFVKYPGRINELIKYGKVIGYYETATNGDDPDKLYPPMDYIHFICDRGANREKLQLEDKDEKVKEYTLRYGTSFVDGARHDFKVMSLIEDILLLARLSRSSLYRIFKINVGTSNKKDTLKIIREIKSAIESKQSLDTLRDRFRSENNPIPVSDNIYLPVRDGKGDIMVDNIGGDYDLKHALDVEYFRNKLFASLKVPKAFLGFEEGLPGTIGNTTMTRLDVRYARTIKRLKTILKAGIKDMCNYYLLVNEKKNKLNKFMVRSSSVSSAEDVDRVEQIDGRIRLADSLTNLLTREYEAHVDKDKLVRYIGDNILNLKDIDEVFLAPEEVDTDVDDADDGGFF